MQPPQIGDPLTPQEKEPAHRDRATLLTCLDFSRVDFLENVTGECHHGGRNGTVKRHRGQQIAAEMEPKGTRGTGTGTSFIEGTEPEKANRTEPNQTPPAGNRERKSGNTGECSLLYTGGKPGEKG